MRIPEGFRGQQVVFRAIVGPRDGGGSTAETLCYINGKPVRVFKEAALCVVDAKVDRFYYTIDTVLRCAQLLDEGDLRRFFQIGKKNDAKARFSLSMRLL